MSDCVNLGTDLEDIEEDYEDKYQQSSKLRAELATRLKELAPMLASSEFVNPHGPSVDDIILFSELRPLTLVKGVRFGNVLEAYMLSMSVRADMPLFRHVAM
eukprot:CAMPEP_0170195650 /NCGR_PEP_ID=MMETSP0040_2-20121228/61913_1 /TAXON_ID=641309 /ORGANISM="Lotharella oceanica, Strain CCMP622" /LENGTH=101 /DNA_ID=CAMNT_0010444857 /DNA_START=27 /DNA_END=332 /DNA_ORIENTATION=+